MAPAQADATRPAPPPSLQPAAPALPAAPAPRLEPTPPPAIEVSPLRYEDLPAVLELINADLLPGQPTCTRQTLDMALRGESPVDSPWWKELAGVQAIVARRGGEVVGAGSFAQAAADRSGWLLWLHAREDRTVVEAMVDCVLDQLGASPHVYAFWIATALTLGVEALPVVRRPVTHAVLQARGLVGRDSWCYLVAPLGRGSMDAAADVAAVQPASAPGGLPTWRLTVGDPEQPSANAEVALGDDGCGALLWIDVEPPHRGRGMGRGLLLQAMRFLALRGARTVATFVDQDDPRERDRRPALRLLHSTGFREMDRLWSYELPRRRAR